MQARERRDALKRLVGAITSSRPWAFLASSHLARRIRHSLSARLAVAITLAVLVIVLVSGGIIASQLRTSMFETRRDAILADASLRFSSAQSVFSSSTASSPAQVQESARGALASLKASAAGAGATNVALLRSEGTTASLRINQIEDEQMRGLVTAQMRAAVAGGGAQWQSVAIRSSDGKKEEPGILVGTQVQLPRAGTHELYILYSLSADQAQVDVVLRVLLLSSLPVIVALPIGVFALLHRLLDGGEVAVEDCVDAAADGARGVRVLMEAEECVAADALDGMKYIGKRDLCERARDVGAALASARDGDESRAAQLSEDAADDDGMCADAAREGLARGGGILSIELDADEDVDGDGEAA